MEKELSKEREDALKLHLQTKLYVKLQPIQIKKIIKVVNRIRKGEITVHDWLPNFSGAVTYGQMMETFDTFDFLVL